MLILLNTARIVFAQKRHAVQLKRIAKRTDMQHQFRQGQFQIRSRLNRRLIRHVIRIFLLHDRVTCLQNLARRTARNHLLDPSGLLAQTFFLFRHRRQGNLNLLVGLAGKLSPALFAKINRRRLQSLPHRRLLDHAGLLAKILARNLHKIKGRLGRTFPQQIQIHLRRNVTRQLTRLRRAHTIEIRLQQHVFGFHLLQGRALRFDLHVTVLLLHHLPDVQFALRFVKNDVAHSKSVQLKNKAAFYHAA